MPKSAVAVVAAFEAKGRKLGRSATLSHRSSATNSAGSGDPALHSPQAGDEAGAGRHVEFVQDGAHLILHCCLGLAEGGGDFAVAQAFGEMHRHQPLRRGELRQRWARVRQPRRGFGQVAVGEIASRIIGFDGPSAHRGAGTTRTAHPLHTNLVGSSLITRTRLSLTPAAGRIARSPQ